MRRNNDQSLKLSELGYAFNLDYALIYLTNMFI